MPAPAAAAPAAPQQQARGPANICQELVLFVRAPAAAQAATAPPPQQATAVQAPAQAQSVPQPNPAGGAPQQSSGISAPVSSSGPGATGPQGAAQANPSAPQAGQGQTAAAPSPAPAPGSSPQAAAQNAPAAAAATAPPPTPTPSPAQIELVQKLAGENDIKACRDEAQKMRKAGVALPAPLLALAALDLKLLDLNAKR